MPLLRAHARDDRRPRPRGDPAPGDRLLDHALRDVVPCHAGVTATRRRPDVAYRYMKKVLQVLQHLRGGDRWVLKSPQHLEQFAGAGRRVPRRDLRGHPPRPGRRDRVDVDDGHLRRPHERRPPRPGKDRRLLVDRGRADAGRAPATGTSSPPTSRSTCASTSSWPTTSRWSSGSTTSPASRMTDRRAGAMDTFVAEHPRGRHGSIEYDITRSASTPSSAGRRPALLHRPLPDLIARSGPSNARLGVEGWYRNGWVDVLVPATRVWA